MDVGARRGDSGDGRCLSLIRPLVGGWSRHRGASVGGVALGEARRAALWPSGARQGLVVPTQVVGLLGRSLAAAGKDVDPQESLWDFKGREAKPVASDVRHGRQAAISGRSKRVSTFGREH
jgi:hypothetical protein